MFTIIAIPAVREKRNEFFFELLKLSTQNQIPLQLDFCNDFRIVESPLNFVLSDRFHLRHLQEHVEVRIFAATLEY